MAMTIAKMLLLSGRYRFPITVVPPTDDNPDTYTIWVGGKDDPCLLVTVDKEYATIQDLHYYPTCSVNGPLERRSGVHVMVRATLKWMLSVFPGIEAVLLNDKSSYKSASGRYVLLPEKLYLLEGKTWYQKHFGAIPDEGDVLKARLAQYDRVRRKIGPAKIEELKALPDSAWTVSNIGKTLRQFNLYMGITSSGWKILPETVHAYTEDFSIIEENDRGSRSRKIAVYSGGGRRHKGPVIRTKIPIEAV